MRSGLKMMTTAFIIGFLIIIFTNISYYQDLASSSNSDLIEAISPVSIKEIKKQEISTIVDGLEQGLESQYNMQTSDVRNACGPMYTGLVTALEDFRTEQNKVIDELDISGYAETTLPGYGIFNKLSPIFSALGLAVIMGILNAFCSLLYGLGYMGLKKIHTEEQSSTS